jgi:hypothetical protein
MLVQHREWDASMDPDTAARHGYNSRDFDQPQIVAEIVAFGMRALPPTWVEMEM